MTDEVRLLREALEVIAAKPEDAPYAIGVTARNIARAALSRSPDPIPAPEVEAAHPEDYCHRCGKPNPVWWADNDLWNEVMGDESGIVCPSCFARAAIRTAAPSVDVERLAEAIAAVDLSLPPSNDRERTHWRSNAAQLEQARAIVAEYDRLGLP